MARGMTGMIDRELGDAVMQIRDADFFRALLQDVVEATKVKRRQIFAIRIAGPILDRARNSNHALDAGIVRSDVRISKRPIDVVSVQRSGAKIDIAKARRGPSPKVGFSADGPATWPGPLGSRSRRVPDFVLPHARHPFAVHETNGLRALRGIAEPAKLHLPRFAVVAKVFARIEPAPRVDTANFEARFAERFDGHPAAGAASNHDYVIDLL